MYVLSAIIGGVEHKGRKGAQEAAGGAQEAAGGAQAEMHMQVSHDGCHDICL